MFIVNGEKAILRKYNRTDSDNIYDDVNYIEVPIKVCSYDREQAIRFGIYTIPEATGYYQVPRWVDIEPGDQIKFIGNYDNKYDIKQKEINTVLEVQHGHLFNRNEVKIAVVK